MVEEYDEELHDIDETSDIDETPVTPSAPEDFKKYIDIIDIQNKYKDSKEFEEFYKDHVRILKPKITKYERTGIIGQRIEQLAKGATPLIQGDFVRISDIAETEYNKKVLPFITINTSLFFVSFFQ